MTQGAFPFGQGQAGVSVAAWRTPLNREPGLAYRQDCTRELSSEAAIAILKPRCRHLREAISRGISSDRHNSASASATSS
eukprot:scaffold48_cov311-Pinguiococcus_pyrenoidosus.AAC.102